MHVQSGHMRRYAEPRRAMVRVALDSLLLKQALWACLLLQQGR